MGKLENYLTVIVPTRNRSALCVSLIQYLRRCGVECAIIIADSSDTDHALRNEEFCRGRAADYRRYAPEIPFYDKALDVLNAVTSAFVVMLPDDDIPVPRALEQCVSVLRQNDDTAAAWGYVIDYAMHGEQFDIFRVRWSAPGINEHSPLERVYHLVRRYQPFFWAVFRTGALTRSISEARCTGRIVFQELTTTLTAALQGKIARLPIVYSLRGAEVCSYERAKVEPLFAFLEDPAVFFREYTDYRDNLVRFVQTQLEHAVKQLKNCTVEQFFDLVHGIGLAREIDPGVLNYTVQRALGAPHPPIPLQQHWSGWKEPCYEDIVHTSPIAGRRYVWRKEILKAEPPSTILISQDEIALVEQELNNYRM
jgi:glycosyltransferase domain-containing protein